MVSDWFVEEYATWWWCAACDVYGVMRVCWSCHSPDQAQQACNPMWEGTYQVHTHSRSETPIAGRIVQFTGTDELLEVTP